QAQDHQPGVGALGAKETAKDDAHQRLVGCRSEIFLKDATVGRTEPRARIPATRPYARAGPAENARRGRVHTGDGFLGKPGKLSMAQAAPRSPVRASAPRASARAGPARTGSSAATLPAARACGGRGCPASTGGRRSGSGGSGRGPAAP